MAPMGKNLPAMRETQVRSLSQEDPLEKKTATYSCILAWEIPWTEEPGGLQSMGSQSQTQLKDFHFQEQGIGWRSLGSTKEDGLNRGKSGRNGITF